jgi:hypothetical protein
MNGTTPSFVREAVGVFETEDALQAAIDDLLSHGFNRAELSLLAASSSVENKLGHAYRKVSEIEDDFSAPRIAYVAEEDIGDAEGAIIGGLIYVGAVAGMIPIVASGGALAAAIAGLVVGGGSGAALGSILARLVGNKHGNYVADQVEHGGLALWVRTWNSGDERRAVQILKAHSGKDVHLHGLPDHGYVPDKTVLTVGADEDQSTQISDDGSGVFYVSGKMFSDKATAQAYLDRQRYLDTLYQSSRSLEFDLDAALLDPATAFDSVDDVLKIPCSDSLKLELLRRWAYDVTTLEVADDEGMTGPTSADLMQRIEQAILQLESA